jgi:hypothetical protein
MKLAAETKVIKLAQRRRLLRGKLPKRNKLGII